MRKVFLPFEEAHKKVISAVVLAGIDTERKWQYHNKYNFVIPDGVPCQPSVAYKDKGWISWGYWLGTGNIRGQLRKYKVNDDFFKVWTNDMAYVLGFWYADGNMRTRKRDGSIVYCFSICQNTKDRYILSKILEKMDSDSVIYSPSTRPSSSMFEINSKKIYEDLLTLGGIPDKSKKIRLPEIPDRYLPDYIRGVFDGDGCVTINGKRGYRISFICSGHKKYLEDLKLVLDSHSIHGRIHSNCNKINECFRLDFGINQTKNLGCFMYADRSDELCLERKKQRFIKDGEYIWKQKA